MFKRAVKTVLIGLFMILGTTSCWDSLDIEDRDICTAAVLDKEEDKYVFYVEIASITSKIQNPQSEQGGKQGQNSVVSKGAGKSFAEVRLNVDKELNKPIYLGAVQALVITEDMADCGIEEYAYRVREINEYRKTMDVVITPDEPDEFLQTTPENESTVGFAIEDTLETLISQGKTFHVSLADLLNKLVGKNPCYLLSTLSVKDKQIALVGYTVFEGGMRIGYIPYEQSRGIVLIATRVKNKPKVDCVLQLDDQVVTMETSLNKRDIKATYDGEQVQINMDMAFKSQIRYPSSLVPITPETMQMIKEKVKAQLEKDVGEAITLSQQNFHCDFLSFSDAVRIAYPDAYREMNWEEEFTNVKFIVNITVDVAENETVDYNPYNEGY